MSERSAFGLPLVARAPSESLVRERRAFGLCQRRDVGGRAEIN